MNWRNSHNLCLCFEAEPTPKLSHSSIFIVLSFSLPHTLSISPLFLFSFAAPLPSNTLTHFLYPKLILHFLSYSLSLSLSLGLSGRNVSASHLLSSPLCSPSARRSTSLPLPSTLSVLFSPLSVCLSLSSPLWMLL